MRKNKSNRYCTNTISFNELIDHLTNNKGGQIKEDLIKMEENPKVYVVGSHGPEENNIHSIHFTYEGAFKEWNVLRINLLKRAKLFIKESKYSKEMYGRMIKNLSCEDPEKIDNYPHETPYIHQYEIVEYKK